MRHTICTAQIGLNCTQIAVSGALTAIEADDTVADWHSSVERYNIAYIRVRVGDDEEKQKVCLRL